MSTSFEGSQAFNRLSNAFENVIPNSGSLMLNIPLVSLIGKLDGIGLSIQLSYAMGTPGRLGLPDNWSFNIPFLIPGEALEVKGMRYIIDPDWTDSTGYASGLKYENNHGIAFTNNISGQPLPYGQSGQSYQFTYADTDGARYFFDSTGKLLMQADRHGNFIYYAYTSSNLLDAITDSFGQQTRFGYNPNQIVVTCPDGRTTTLNYTSTGVSSLVDPLGHSTSFTMVQQNGFNVINTIAYPSGKTTSIAYTTIQFLDTNGATYSIPAISDLYYLDQANTMLAHYQYAYGTNSGGNTFTGYQGGYALSSTSDGLLDSNNTLYTYNVEVRSMDAANNILALSDTSYSFAHVPVQQNTYIIDASGTQQGFLQLNSVYDLTPDHHSQQPNYLSPKQTEQLYFANAAASGVAQTKRVYDYDAYGNTTSKQSSSYKPASESYTTDLLEAASYFTGPGMTISSLVNVSTRQDCSTKQVIKTVNTLSADKLDVAASTVSYSDDGGATWNDWKARNMVFDPFGREVSETLRWVKANMPGVQQASTQYAYSYDAANLAITTAITDALGFTSKHVVSTMYGKKVADIQPSGATLSYSYDKIGRLLSALSPTGLRTTYAYTIVGVEGENSTTKTSPLGYQTKSVYDCLGRETASYDNGTPGNPGALRTLSTKRYDLLGNVVAETDIFGNLTTGSFNSLGKATRSVDPQQNQTDVVYDFAANSALTSLNGVPQKKAVTDNCGNTVLEEKYPNTKNPDQASQYTLRRSNVYGGFGNLQSARVSRLDGALETLLFANTYQYDADGQQARTQFSAPDGSGSVTQASFDLNKKEISHSRQVTYPDQRNYTVASDVCQYDALGQMTKLTNRMEQSESYAYNGDNQLTGKTLFDGSLISYQYTPDGQKAQESWTEAGTAYAIAYAYDKDGRLLTTTDSSGTLANAYALDGVLTSIAYPDGKKLAYTLDQYSRKVGMVDVSGAASSYTYTQQNQLATVKNAQDTLTYAYYKDTSKNTILGAPMSVTLANNYTETFQYDAHDRKNATQKRSSTGQVILDESCVLNALNQVASSTMTSALSSDASLNRQRSCTYDAFKQLTSDSVKSSSGAAISDDSYQYDGNANVLVKTSNGVATRFTYNSIDQLVAYTVGSGQAQTQQYDTNGRLVVDGDGNGYRYDLRGKLLNVEGASNTRYGYYPNELLATRSGQAATVQMYYDNTQQVLNAYQNGAAMQFLLVGSKRYAAYSAGSAPYYYGASQRQDTVLGLSAPNASGASLVGSASYQAYGAETDVHLGLDARNNFSWNQEYKDPDNLLVYLRARYYDPKTMRFLSRDSTRLDNRYAFGNGDPINNIDPTGNDALEYVSIGLGVGVGAAAVGVAAYVAITYGAAFTAAVGGTAALGTIGAGTLASVAALTLGLGTGTTGLITSATTLATAAVLGVTGSEIAIGSAIGTTLGTGLGAYAGSVLAGGVGQIIGTMLGGSIGGYVGTAAAQALGYVGTASEAIGYVGAVAADAIGYVGATAASVAATATEATLAAATAAATMATDAVAATAAVATGAAAAAGDAAFALLALLFL
ncbi:MAG: repeat protein [Pseudoduganella sp.]|nr:repeat protein [Pseudoduganella sp.]